MTTVTFPIILLSCWVFFRSDIRSEFSASSKMLNRVVATELLWAKCMGHEYSLCFVGDLGALSIPFLSI